MVIPFTARATIQGVISLTPIIPNWHYGRVVGIRPRPRIAIPLGFARAIVTTPNHKAPRQPASQEWGEQWFLIGLTPRLHRHPINPGIVYRSLNCRKSIKRRASRK